MAEIVNIYDGGITKDPRGRTVGVIRFMISTNEGHPEEIVGHCLPNFHDSIIKNLKRLAWQKPQEIQNELK